MFTFCSHLMLMMLFTIQTHTDISSHAPKTILWCVIMAELNARLMAKRLFHLNKWFFAFRTIFSPFAHIHLIHSFSRPLFHIIICRLERQWRANKMKHKKIERKLQHFRLDTFHKRCDPSCVNCFDCGESSIKKKEKIRNIISLVELALLWQMATYVCPQNRQF